MDVEEEVGIDHCAQPRITIPQRPRPARAHVHSSRSVSLLQEINPRDSDTAQRSGTVETVPHLVPKRDRNGVPSLRRIPGFTASEHDGAGA